MQINTRALITELSRSKRSLATLDDISEDLLRGWAKFGFKWIWLLSVWQTGLGARDVSRRNEAWRNEFEQTLPDLTNDDIQGSGFAITDYRVHDQLGGNASLDRLRSRMRAHGLKLMLDFVPNHMALDHPWTLSQPELFRRGEEWEMEQQPQNFFRGAGGTIFAHGRDPFFDGWPDTVQLDYSHPLTVGMMQSELQRIASMCDGVRCDMAMLILPDVFERTWDSPALPFWSQVIERVKQTNPDFCFLAEVYWDREWDLQQIGFDYCYDKRLYDRLLHASSRSVHMHLVAGLDYQAKLARFLENHDEPRIAKLVSPHRHSALAILTYLTPGLKFFHEGQFEGRQAKVSPHLVRRPDEPIRSESVAFYARLCELLQSELVVAGKWLLLDAKPAWPENQTFERLVCFRWKDAANRHLIVAVNHSDEQAQGRLRLSIDRTCASQVVFKDWFTGDKLEIHRGEVFHPGLLLEFEPWQFYVLEEVDS